MSKIKMMMMMMIFVHLRTVSMSYFFKFRLHEDNHKPRKLHFFAVIFHGPRSPSSQWQASIAKSWRCRYRSA